MELSSSAFADGGEILRRHTCEGDDVAPPLRWRGVPAGTASLVPIADDPDAPDPAAPQRTWVHRVVHDLPALPALVRPTKAAVDKAMHGHVLVHATLVGTYRRQRGGCARAANPASTPASGPRRGATRPAAGR
ncbi:hypothetical protein [Azohydromonas sp.]|uniref:YbhB/YbcL family Raf kinase inhibitor-like protein n=1 Tax=Azohydromonas sp. TaxID=1872666 RepID=UPI002CAF6ED5|nr:hypothetical protein [Azohydromonas sp.]HMM86754.1 hypothetical protein [Azohydromonas sp.]